MNTQPDPGEWANQPVYHPCPADPSCPHCNGSPAPEDRLDWSFVDAAYCISLKTRGDRAAQAAAEFHRVGLCRRVVVYGRFCKKPGGVRGHGMRVMFDVTDKDAHHAPRQA